MAHWVRRPLGQWPQAPVAASPVAASLVARWASGPLGLWPAGLWPAGMLSVRPVARAGAAADSLTCNNSIRAGNAPRLPGEAGRQGMRAVLV